MAVPTKAPRVIPVPGSVPNVKRDALEVFHTLKAGGVVIVPTDTGYGFLSSSAEGIDRAFRAKQRKPGHTLGIIGTYKQHEQIHLLGDTPTDSARMFEMTRVVTEEVGAWVGFIAKYRKDHPRLQQLSPATMEKVTKGDTMGIAISESPLLREIGRLNDEDGQLMIGSSANITGQGAKFLIQDIEPEIIASADLVVDYGLQKYHIYGRSGTIFDLVQMKTIRFGAGYEVLRDRMKRWFGVELVEDPVWKTDGVKRVGVSLDHKE